jgi:hypothetical protein
MNTKVVMMSRIKTEAGNPVTVVFAEGHEGLPGEIARSDEL